MTQPIYFLSSATQYYELSNFYLAKFNLDGKTWLSTESYFQAMKFPGDAAYQEKIRRESNQSQVKKLGSSRAVPMRPDWDSVRDDVMKCALYAKFTQNEDLKDLLLSTGDRPLIENNKRDNYWAIGNGSGLNKLGLMLCDLRTELRQNQ